MRKNYKLLLIVAVGLAAGTRSASADGYRNPPPTADGIGKSGANSVWVDDASAVSYNPANLAGQTNGSVVVSAVFAQTENTYDFILGGSYESDGGWNVLPNLYYSMPGSKKGVTFGLGITTPFGQGLSWDQDEFEQFALGVTSAASPTNLIPYEVSVAMVDIGPTAAFQLRDNLSVGAGVDFYLSQLELEAVNAVYVPALGAAAAFNSEASGFGTAIGAHLGVSWDPADGHRLTATYKSGFKIDYSGDYKLGEMDEVDFETSVEYPHIVTLGYGVQLSERVQIETQVEWLNWSENKGQTLAIEGYDPVTVKNNWDDTFTFGLGGSWQATDALAVSAGYAFIPSPVPDETLTHLLPDADRHAISLGLGYSFGAHRLDLAYTLSMYEDRSAPADGEGPGLYDIDSNLVGLTYSAILGN